MSSAIQRFFGKKTPDELVKKWRQEIRGQQRGIDRQIRAIDAEEAKVKKSIKQVAKKGDVKNCKMLAKELIRSQRHKNRLYTSKAQMNSIIMQLEHQLATLKVAGSLQKSGEVMKLVNQLARLPEISQTMQQMSMEMTKAGIMEEMIGDTMDMMDDDDIEEAADEEVNNVLFQITDGMLGEAGSVGPALESKPMVAEEEEEEEEEEGPELDMMQKRLQVRKRIYVDELEVLI
ncbi:Vacuolar protein-sorting-associated protein 24 [Mucor circinelloides]